MKQLTPAEANKENMKSARKIDDKKFNVETDSPFEAGSDVPFRYLCETFDAVDGCKGQNSKDAMKDLLSKLFRSILVKTPSQLVPAYYFCILKLAPDYENLQMGVGVGILVKCIGRVSGRSDKQVRDSQATLGDLGLVAEKSKSSQSTVDRFFVKKSATKETPVTLVEVFELLRKISRTKGSDSANEKERLLEGLMRRASPMEVRYIIRFIEGNLKLGAAEKTMQSALSLCFYIHNKTQNNSYEDFESSINRALCECPNYEFIIKTLMEIGPDIEKLVEICHITPGTPCKPMLAKPMKSIQMIFHRFENLKFTCEYKYDGLRGQIHCKDGQITIFSRNLENMTEAYPDIVSLLKEYLEQNPHIKDFILDSEVVAFDPKTKRILPFQVLSTRGRKNVEASQIDVQVSLFLFDLLYLNNKSYLQSTLMERRAALKQNFTPVEGKLLFAESMDSESFEEIEEFLTQSVRIGCEGLMIKTLEVKAQYEPARRSFNWLKLKKDYLDSGLGDTFDLVPIAALRGTGKRKGFYGSYLLACYNEDMDTYETICKIGTGFSDEYLEKFFNMMQEHIIPAPLQEYKGVDVEMDVWFSPSMVWEVKAADLQISPVYQACSTILEGGKGVGLRFPRLIQLRADKKPNEASSSQFIYDIYKQQAVVKNQSQLNDEEDFY